MVGNFYVGRWFKSGLVLFSAQLKYVIYKMQVGYSPNKSSHLCYLCKYIRPKRKKLKCVRKLKVTYLYISKELSFEKLHYSFSLHSNQPLLKLNSFLILFTRDILCSGFIRLCFRSKDFWG